MVTNELENKRQASLVGTAFDYLARFRIAHFLKREDVCNGLVPGKGT